MLVSIITPSFNQANYLEATIQSVLGQEYSNLEYIIVDGASTDGSIDIIQKYASQLSWWVSEPDNGQADAINKGLQRAKGDVVGWINSDDLYLPGAIHESVAVLQTNPNLMMVYGDAITIDDIGRPLNLLSFDNWGLQDLMRFRIICQPAVFMRRTAVKQVGYLDEKFHFMLDHHLWLRIANTGKVKHIDDIWAAARHHQSAKNVAHSAAFVDEINHIVGWMKTDPILSSQFRLDKRRILGGANRLSGRYLLDGGLPGPALQSYFRALIYWPSFALRHWGRIAFAFANLLGIGNLKDWSRQQTPKLNDPRLKHWPGVNLNYEP